MRDDEAPSAEGLPEAALQAGVERNRDSLRKGEQDGRVLTAPEVPLASASDEDMSGCRDQLELGPAVRMIVREVRRRCSEAMSQSLSHQELMPLWLQEQVRFGRDRGISSANGHLVALTYSLQPRAPHVFWRQVVMAACTRLPASIPVCLPVLQPEHLSPSRSITCFFFKKISIYSYM